MLSHVSTGSGFEELGIQMFEDMSSLESIWTLLAVGFPDLIVRQLRYAYSTLGPPDLLKPTIDGDKSC